MIRMREWCRFEFKYSNGETTFFVGWFWIAAIGLLLWSALS